ncbi:hypothetical protein J5A54_09760 [Prevotella melaninogenica]|jgi:hypothetical protein|uniref:hypothetical protein n=1 Tax=Prevotella melaninogenica TaxID=28132 RepID=UPI001BAC0CD3|nr:hypothetical protein [Prevotella melaninogenica]QUB64699.1 hypothetical protein J5A54_09760 [Prevotella melaninogenica]
MEYNKERKPKNNGCIFSIVFFLGLVALAMVLDSKEAVQLFGVIPLFIAGMFLIFYVANKVEDEVRDVKETNAKSKYIAKLNSKPYNELYDSGILSDVEQVTGINLATYGDKNAKELIETMIRWSKKVNCPISQIFMTYFHFLEDRDDEGLLSKSHILDLINDIVTEKNKEIENFNIEPKNTCAYYKMKWLKKFIDGRNDYLSSEYNMPKIETKDMGEFISIWESKS